jgi:hypothetical protein
MKTSYKLICLFVLIAAYASCKKDPSQGLPSSMVVTKPDSVLISKTTTVLRDSASANEVYATLFDTATEKRLILTSDANVYVTFLYEGATWENSFGYYTYLLTDSPSIANKQILFPNISGAGGGGALVAGDMVQLGTGKFPKGTVIGFFLVAQGWQDGHIMPGIYTHYTDSKFNIAKRQQSVLFVEKNTGKLVLGFEDIAASGGDYNDVVVSVSDSSDPSAVPVAFDLTKVPKL